MPADSERQARLMRLALYYKRHGKLPPGAGRASAELKRMAAEMSEAALRDSSHRPQQRRGTMLTGARYE